MIAHTEAVDNAVAPDCTNSGLTEGKHCSVCNTVLIAQTKVPANGHTVVVDEAVAPTCTESGLTEGKHCSVCNATLIAQTVVNALGHTVVTDEAVAPTCTKTGLTEGSHCSVCNTVFISQTILSMIAHTEAVDNAVAPDCTNSGLTEGKHCSVCNTVLIAQTKVPANGHTVVVDEAVAPTCTESGLTEGKHCSVCNATLIAQTTVSAKGHTEVIDKAVAPTCTATGLTEGKHCSVCNVVLVEQTSVPMLDHTESEWLVLRAPTENEVGQKYTQCVDCKKILNVVEIPATHIHNYTEWIEVPSYGCSAFSYNFKYCLDCGNKVIDAPEGADIIHPHEFDKISTEATCTSEGVVYRFECINCGFVAAEKTTPALGHTLDPNSYVKYDEFYHLATCTRCGEDIKELHHHTDYVVVEEATCEGYGYIEGTCDKCGDSGTHRTLPRGHNYGDYVYINESRHARECLRCGKVRFDGHTVYNWTTVVEPTCISTGLDEGYCVYCGGYTTRVTSEWHDLVFESFTPGSSCLDGGSVNYVCRVCGYRMTLELLAPGHDYKKVTRITEPTCTTFGKDLYVCSRCGAEDERLVWPLGHLYHGVTIKLPDCYNTGLVRFTCQREGCSAVVETVTEKRHSFNSGVITKAPTCTSEGEIVYTCRDCGVTVEYTLPVVHDLTYHAGVSATCTEDGRLAYYTCDDCGKYFSGYYTRDIELECDGRTYLARAHTVTYYLETQYDKTYVEAYGHLYSGYNEFYDEDKHYCYCLRCETLLDSEEHTMTDEWVVMTQIVPGSYKYYLVRRWDCTKCDYYYYDENIATGKPIEIAEEHNVFVVIQPTLPTCTKSGLDVGLKCGVCDEILYAQEELPALGHDFVDGVCSRCGLTNGSQGLEFTLNSDGQSYSVKGIGTCKDTDIIIPPTYNGLPVTKIGSSAFRYCTGLTSVIIPDSVTSIGSFAFVGCTSLTSVTIGNSVTDIGSAFNECSSLTNITVVEDNEYLKSIDGNLYTKDGKTLVRYASGKTDSSFTIPDSVTSIGNFAFYNCSNLTKVNIPDGVTSVGGYAFSGCTSLTSITIPYGVTSIDYGTFRYCSSLTNITIPEGVKSVNDDAFLGCISLISITVDEDNKYYKSIDGNLYTKDGKTLIQYAVGKTDISFTIPDSVTKIRDEAFYNCSSLASVTIPDSVTSIGSLAFEGCTNLTSITFGEDSQLVSIGSSAFDKCTSLTSINIPDGVTSIEGYAFCGCTSLTSINIPDGVTSIGDNTFNQCYSLTSITFGEDSQLVSIGYMAFYSCESLTSITIPDSVTSIGDNAFGWCTSLTNITFGEDSQLVSIGSYAFYNCTSLTNITIPDSVTSIVDNAFYSCSRLYVVYNNSDFLVEIGSSNNGYVGYYAKILVDNGVTTYANDGYEYILTDNRFLFDYDGSQYRLIAYCGGENTVTLPGDIYGNVYEIYKLCGVVNVIIPDSIKSIGDHAFDYCTTLTSIGIPDSVTSIGARAFQSCRSLTSITIPDSVMSIGYDAFKYCYNLTSITYEGAIDQWNAITKGSYWDNPTGSYTIYCTDGEITKDGTVTYYPEAEETLYTRDGDYIYFGEYPQTIKADDVTITDTQDSRGYFLGSDGFYYAAVTATPNFASYTFTNKETIVKGKVYYFKVESIRWRILSEDGEKAFILCDSIIANQIYDDSYNNYANSEIRKWLNETFYETAFSELQREIILITTVNNAASTTGESPNNNSCANTEDKIFLLSYAEVTNSEYGFSSDKSEYDVARQMENSDYVRAMGAIMDEGSYYGNGWWWLRSPRNDGNDFQKLFMASGQSSADRVYCKNGIVPAMWINLNP